MPHRDKITDMVFWSDSDSEADFLEMVEVCYGFYWRSLQASFPVRGCVVLGDVEFDPYNIAGAGNARFYNSSMYGAGIVDAYVKGENQDWAGAYVDRSALEAVRATTVTRLVEEKKLITYTVP